MLTLQNDVCRVLFAAKLIKTNHVSDGDQQADERQALVHLFEKRSSGCFQTISDARVAISDRISKRLADFA